MSGKSEYTGMWIVVDDAKRGQKCGNGGKRKWMSAYSVYDQYFLALADGTTRKIPESNGFMSPGEKYGQWYLDQWTNRTTNVDLPPASGVAVPKGFWDMPGILHVPGFPNGLPAGLAYVYKRKYAISVVCVCERYNEMLRSPLSVLGYSLIDIRKMSSTNNQSAEVSTLIGIGGPSAWGALARVNGVGHGLTPVDKFTNDCC